MRFLFAFGFLFSCLAGAPLRAEEDTLDNLQQWDEDKIQRLEAEQAFLEAQAQNEIARLESQESEVTDQRPNRRNPRVNRPSRSHRPHFRPPTLRGSRPYHRSPFYGRRHHGHHRYHFYPSHRRHWNVYPWYRNPYRYPWYHYGYYRFPSYSYPGYEYGYHYTGLWRCVGYDAGYEEHAGGHEVYSRNYNTAYDDAYNACRVYHGECVVSCERAE